MDELEVEVAKTKAILEATIISMKEQKDVDVYGCLLVILDQFNKIDSFVEALE